MASPDHSRFWRTCRTAFRRFRLCVWMVLLVFLGALLYLHQIGLPGFLKTPLLERFRARGLDLEFTRMRWHWDRGLVAEDVRFGRAEDSSGPELKVREMAVRPALLPLAKLQFRISSLGLRQGRLTWPVQGTNGAPRELVVDNIEARLRLKPGDVWELNHFLAHFAGANIRLSATITNASAIRTWKVFQAPPRLPAGARRDFLRRLADAAEHTHFATAPELIVETRGDARQWRSFDVRIHLASANADTPWGTLQEGSLSAELAPDDTNQLCRARVDLRAGSAQTPWAAITNLALALRLVPTDPAANAIDAGLDLAAASVAMPWLDATNAHLTAGWVHSRTNAVPLVGRGEIQLNGVRTKWGGAGGTRLSVRFSRPTETARPADASWGWWTNLAPYALTWQARVTGYQSSGIEVDEVACGGQWLAPELQVTQALARLYGGKLETRFNLPVTTRRLGFSASSDFNVKPLARWLPTNSQPWLSDLSCPTPPRLEVEGELTVPPWTNRQPDWLLEIEPSLALSGHVRLENGAFRGVPATLVDSHFSCSNEVWRLPDLFVQRPEGRLEVVHETHRPTGDFYFRIRSSIDPRAVRPALSPKQQRPFDLVTFTQPPVIHGELRGCWRDPDRLNARGRVAATNFTFRGQSADGLQTALEYTNKVLKFIEPRLQRDQGRQQLVAAGVGVDLAAERVWITNGVSTAEPLAVARAIGPRTGRAFEPYHFLLPPTVHVEGTLPFHGEQDGDLHCDIEGESFEWWKFKVPRINGQLHWVKDRLLLRNVQGDFYRGAGTGDAEFNLAPGQPTEFSFDAKVTKADLHLLMGDLSTRTNRFEGVLSGRLEITHARVEDWQSWQGRGRVNLRDGLIWEFPLFGILSPVLDSLMPGLGSSRASEGSSAFAITNGVIASDNLEIKASMMRLQYWGTIDLTGKVNARAQAELLRDTWVVGRVLSLALWPVSKIFLYKITGTLDQPRSEPVLFVPKIVLFPFQAIRALGEPMTEEPPRTNAPPARPRDGTKP